MMNNYWSSRAVELEKLLQDKTNATIVEINKLYSDVSKSIASKIAKIFETYKKGGQIDSAHALQLLTAHQTAEQRKELLELLSRTTDKKARREIISMLDAPTYADRISRLQALQDLVKAEALQLGIAEEKLTTARLKDVAKASYYRTIYNDQKNIGKAYDFNKISSRQLKAMLAHKWSGNNYSARIWNNNDKFIDKLQRTIEVGCMAGLTLRELEDRIVDDCIGETSDEGQRFCASRLIRTEVNYFANQGMLMGYEEAGIKKYLFVATLDLRTSEICRKLDLKSFPVSEAEAGVNLPPMHPFCRSVTIPDTGSRSGTRWARNPITGKSMKVPADMTYEQWYDKYVLKSDENRDTIVPAGKSPYSNESLAYSPDAEYKVNIEGLSDNVNNGLTDACRQVAELGYADGKEHLAMVDLKTGNIVYTETGLSSQVGGGAFWQFVRENPNRSFAFVHNHNTPTQFSETDLMTLSGDNCVDMFIISRYDGKMFVLESNGKTRGKSFFDDIYEDAMNELSTRIRNGEIESADRSRFRETILVNNAIKDYTKGVKEFG